MVAVFAVFDLCVAPSWVLCCCLAGGGQEAGIGVSARMCAQSDVVLFGEEDSQSDGDGQI